MKNIDQQIEETLRVLDGISRAEPKLFFYTRLKARMEREQAPSTFLSGRLKPALLVSMLACSLVLSVVSVYTFLNYEPTDNSLSGREAFIQECGLNESVNTLTY